MKRKGLILACMVASLALIGCSGGGEKSPNTIQNELGISKEEAKDILDELGGKETTQKGSDKEQEEAIPTQELTDVTKQEYKLFDAVPEWDEMTTRDGAIQIDDTLYYPGISCQDFVDKINSSSVDYSFEYNGNKLITGKGVEGIEVYRDGNKWFTFGAWNVNEKTTSLSECVVSEVVIEECTKNYCRIINGSTFADLMKLTYTEAVELQNTLFAGFRLYERGEKDYIYLQYTGIEAVERSWWSGYTISVESQFTIKINVDDSLVSSVNCRYGCYASEKIEKQIKWISSMKQEEIDMLLQEAQRIVLEKYESVDSSVVGYCIQEEKYSNEYNLCIVIELTKEDGTKTFVDCELCDLRKKEQGNFVYKKSYLGKELNTVDEVIETHGLKSRITETTLK